LVNPDPKTGVSEDKYMFKSFSWGFEAPPALLGDQSWKKLVFFVVYFWPSWIRIRIRKTGTRYKNVLTGTCEDFCPWGSCLLLLVTHFSRLASAAAAVAVSAANYSSLFQLPLFRAACFNFCGSARSFGSEQLVSAAVIRSSLRQLLLIRQLQLLEDDEASSSGAQQLGSAPAGQGIQVRLLDSCALGNNSWRHNAASNSCLGQEHPIIM
jgi:hypothetical protein